MSTSFINANTGLVVGFNGTIRKTTNGGANWFAQNSGTTYNLKKVIYKNSSVGYICGNNSNINSSIILKTSSGGNSWNESYISANELFYSISFPTDDIGYAVGKDIIIKTTNGGNTWSAVTSILHEYSQSIYFPTTNTGYIASGSGKIIKTTNGGVNWFYRNQIIVMQYMICSSYQIKLVT
ncbi:MAG: hypothetical protein IPJ45_13420 [Ignavibacteria bacterium]|nr:hypothetical protein [Ignavibacteria bacterium]